MRPEYDFTQDPDVQQTAREAMNAFSKRPGPGMAAAAVRVIQRAGRGVHAVTTRPAAHVLQAIGMDGPQIQALASDLTEYVNLHPQSKTEEFVGFLSEMVGLFGGLAAPFSIPGRLAKAGHAIVSGVSKALIPQAVRGTIVGRAATGVAGLSGGVTGLSVGQQVPEALAAGESPVEAASTAMKAPVEFAKAAVIGVPELWDVATQWRNLSIEQIAEKLKRGEPTLMFGLIVAGAGLHAAKRPPTSRPVLSGEPQPTVRPMRIAPDTATIEVSERAGGKLPAEPSPAWEVLPTIKRGKAEQPEVAEPSVQEQPIRTPNKLSKKRLARISSDRLARELLGRANSDDVVEIIEREVTRRIAIEKASGDTTTLDVFAKVAAEVIEQAKSELLAEHAPIGEVLPTIKTAQTREPLLPVKEAPSAQEQPISIPRVRGPQERVETQAKEKGVQEAVRQEVQIPRETKLGTLSSAEIKKGVDRVIFEAYRAKAISEGKAAEIDAEQSRRATEAARREVQASKVTQPKPLSSAEKGVDRALQEQKAGEVSTGVQQPEVPQEGPQQVPAQEGARRVRGGGKKEAITTKVESMNVADIGVDPEAFQFKTGVDEAGAGKALKGAKRFDPQLAGVIAVWTDPTGKTWVVNGHHRLALAKRSGAQTVNVLRIQADDATEARSIGALMNISEGRGTPVDAAKFMRDSGMTSRGMADRNIDLSDYVANEAAALANLNPDAFRDVATGKMTPRRGAIIGRGLPDHADQRAMFEALKKRPSKVPDDVLQEMIRLVKDAPREVREEATLFGIDATTVNQFARKAEISNYVRQRIAKEKRAFGAVSGADRAKILSEAKAAEIDVERSKQLTEAAAVNLFLFDKKSVVKGDVSDALNRAVKTGDLTHAKESAYRDIIKALREVDTGGAATSVGPGATIPAVKPQPQKPAASAPAAKDLLGERVAPPPLTGAQQPMEFVDTGRGEILPPTKGRLHQGVTAAKPVKGVPGQVTLGIGEGKSRQEIPAKPAVEDVKGQRNLLSEELGAVDVEVVKKAAKSIADYVGGPVSLYATQLVDRVRRQGGPVGKVIARKADQAIRRRGEIAGRLEPIILKLQKKFAGQPLKIGTQQPKASKELRRTTGRLTPGKIDPRARYARAQQIIENPDVYPSNLEYRWANIYMEFLRISGREIVRSGVKVMRKGGPVPFVPARNANKFIRVHTRELQDAMMKEAGQIWEILPDVLAKENGLKPKEVVEVLRQWLGPKAERTVGQMERPRVLKNFPTHLKLTNGKIVQLLESDPVRSVQGAARFIADRASSIEFFGQAFGEKDSPVNRMRSKFSRAGGNITDFNRLIAALNGRSLTPSLIMGEAAHASLVSRAIIGALNPIYRGLALSASVFPNVPEAWSKVPAHAGTYRLMRAYADVIRHPVQTREHLRRIGAITTSIMDWHLERGHKIEDFGRLAQGTLTRTFGSHYANELNETLAAQAGKIFGDDLRAGRVGFGDRSSLRILGFQQADIAKMVSGKADPKLYDDIARKVAALTQGSTLSRAQRSVASNNPYFKFAFDFQNYTQITVERMFTVLREVGKDFRSSKPSRVAEGMFNASKFFVGSALAGRASLFLTGLAFGVAYKSDDILSWLGRGMLEAGLSGPARTFGFIDPSRGLGDAVTRLTPKGRALMAVWDAVTQRGRFADKKGPEIALELMKSVTPITRLQRGFLVAAGLRDADLDEAISKAWEFLPKEENRGVAPSPKVGYKEFRRWTGRAYEGLRNGDRDKAIDSLNRAMSTGRLEGDTERESVQRIRQSLLGRQLLRGMTGAELTELEKKIGTERIMLLVRHDAMLELWAGK